jgi:3-hydroxyacyl-[acyl-carrier-protein] dehydratase
MVPIERIMKFLPHRFPFLLVDRVVDMVPRKTIVAIKNVTCNEQFFQGHFPEWKIMPGVLIVEAMAQAGAVLLFSSIPDPETKFVVLSKVDKAKFKRMVVPGDQLRLDVEWTRAKGKICQMKGQAFVGSDLAAEAEIYATILDVAEVASSFT